MNITKLNKQLKAHIKQEISERAGYLYRELDNIIGWYHIEREDRIIDALDESVDRNLNEILLNRLTSILEHYIEKKENLEALKGCYSEDCYASRYLALNMLFYPMIYTTF